MLIPPPLADMLQDLVEYILRHPSLFRSSQQQATFLFPVFAITPFHCFGLYSTLAISYPR